MEYSSKRKMGTWPALILVGTGLFVMGITGLWMYMDASGNPLHPNLAEVPSVTQSAPLPKWAVARERSSKIVRASLADQNLPGLSVAVGIGSGIVWAEGFGFADLDNRVPIRPDHRFRIGTASKVLTSVAAGLLLEKSSLKLDEPIQTYVPAFPAKQWPVTLRQIMGHVGGIGTDGGDEGPLFTEHCQHPVEALPHFADQPLLFEPGTQYSYSSYGWILVSAAVEAAARKPFFTYLREQVFDPLGMHDTLPDAAVPNRATSYFPRFIADPTYGQHLMRDLDYSCYAGASAFLSTPSDLVRFGMAINGGKLLRRSTVQLLQASQRLASGKETGYGLGWDLETVTLAGKQTRVAGHDGDLLGGMAASLMTFPKQGMVVAVTSNISYADTFSLASKIAQAFVE